MKDGFLRVATATFPLQVADCSHNAQQIINTVLDADQKGVHILALPELCITGASCGDLFFQKALLDASVDSLFQIAQATKNTSVCFSVGLPLCVNSNLYNVAAVVSRGAVLGFVPKSVIRCRYFSAPPKENVLIPLRDAYYPFGVSVLFRAESLSDVAFAIEIGEDLYAPNPPSVSHALAAATLILHMSATPALIGADQKRLSLMSAQSARLHCAYLSCNAGVGESTTNAVYNGVGMIFENGTLCASSLPFESGLLYYDVDFQLLTAERRRAAWSVQEDGYEIVSFTLPLCDLALKRHCPTSPFLPQSAAELTKRCEDILQMQAQGLAKRLRHTHCKVPVLAVSGGLDSTLALLVTAIATDLIGLDRSTIQTVTMPCFGTTKRTKSNAQRLCEALGTTFSVIDITKAVRQHLEDIGHDESVHDITYENAQARERTQVAMDFANRMGGMVIGTGDLSELVLGWATYNGDHMSMYGVNASIPKTLVRHLVAYYASHCNNPSLASVLQDILDTPVSPELLPADGEKITQQTEDIVGPYALHDFFLYYLLRYGFTPAKILRLAVHAFTDVYDKATISHWLQIFLRRFFAQQFKRSCLPDGAKIGSVSISPRGDFAMPSDACATLWLDGLES